MAAYARILVPTDLSDFGNLALRYAQLFAERLGSRLTLLHAAELSFTDYFDQPMGEYLESIPEAKQAAVNALSEHARQHLPRSLHVQTMVVDDRPARAIATTADDIDADLIIMGTHGRTGLRRALLGSVTERVLRETSRPVLTVAPALFPARAEVAVRTVLCPVRSSDVSQVALEQASTMADAFDARLVVMPVPENGDAAARVLAAADQMKADLLVVGAQHRFFSDATIIGTTTERITRFARRPVLTVIRGAAAARVAAAA